MQTSTVTFQEQSVFTLIIASTVGFVQENKNMKIEKTAILRAILTIGYSDVNPCKDFKKKLKTRRPLRATNVCLCITAEKVMTCLL